ncbi:hypothetical protein [Spirosoma sp.]|uniref:hypothetical protein n=1 Tax=Spirosoma sp. TaxID=1899569 RepID=UPI0026123286|nr:hypothetical protein [Spirosoma sp.]MCX6219051.1 hypothetical protein [Spirosoma sp.]
MELDEFGALFNARFQEGRPEKSAQELTQHLRGRSRTALEKIIRNILWEVITAIASILVMLVLVTRLDSYTIRWLTGIIGIISITQIVGFSWQYWQLRQMIRPDVTDLRTHLRHQIQVVERFIRMYFSYCLWVVPICFFLGAYIGYTVAAQRIHDPLLLPLDSLALSKTAVFILLAILVAGLVGFLFLVKAYIRWLYGRHLDQLKTCLTELDD